MLLKKGKLNCNLLGQNLMAIKWTRDWRTARAPSAVPAPLHIEKAVLHAYSQESFTGEVGPVDMTCLTTEYGLKKTNCGRLVVLNFH